VNKTAKEITLDSPYIEKLRKDFLTLMKNVPRVKTYQDGALLRDAVKTFKRNFNEVFFDHFLNHDFKYSEDLSDSDKQYIDKKLRKSAWGFYIELDFPLPTVGGEYDSMSEGAALYTLSTKSEKWATRIKGKARVFWKDFDECLQYYQRVTKKPGFSAKIPDQEKVTIEGFTVTVVGYDYESNQERQAEYMERFREGLKIFKKRAQQVLPLMLKTMLPIKLIAYLRKLDEGGIYKGDHIEIIMSAFGDYKHGNEMAHVIAHEMGHHLYRVYLSGSDQEFWNTAVRGNYGPFDAQRALEIWPKGAWLFQMPELLKDKDPTLAIQMDLLGRNHDRSSRDIQSREEFEAALAAGKVFTVPQNPITGYAGKNPEEAFCEAIGMLVGYGPRTVDPLVLHWLQMILPGVRTASQAEKVLSRYRNALNISLKVLERFTGVPANLPSEGRAFNWDDNDSMADALLDGNLELSPADLPNVVLAKYTEKKEVPKANGKGKTTVYVYSDKAVSKRNNDKAERLEKFSGKVDKLRAKYKSDLKAKDPETRMVALAVALIDETHERVGNEESAKGEKNDSGDPHYGVTGWKKSHITLGSGSAAIKYVGKSGVKHEKTVSTPAILSALRQAYKEADGKDGCLFSNDDVTITAAKVNEYLEPFEITAKDLRGLSANSLMQKALKKARKGTLPSDPKDKEEKLKAEFEEALEEVAEELGHEPSTLSNQYLAPGMEPAYMKDGTIIDKLDD
jgi:hypothetical protein